MITQAVGRRPRTTVTKRGFEIMYRLKINSDFNVEQVLQIYRQEKWLKPEKDNKKLLKKMIAGSYAFAGLYKDDEIIGIGRITSDGVSDAYIHDVAVRKEYRGRGLGVKIVKALLAYISRKGIDWIVLIAQPGTKIFWNKLGFSIMKAYIPMKLRKQVAVRKP
jgi:spermidine synthase